MKRHPIPTLLLMLMPFAAYAEEPPATPPDETSPSQADAGELPYGTGYEARQRLAEGAERSGAREESQAQERDRAGARETSTEARAARRETDRAAAQRESRREAREQRPPRGH